MKKLSTLVLPIIVLLFACNKPGADRGQVSAVVSEASIPASQLNAEQMEQVSRLNNDSKVFDYAQACNDVFLQIRPGSSPQIVQNLARLYLQPKLSAFQKRYGGTLLRRSDAVQILRTSLNAQLTRMPRLNNERYFSPDPCRQGFENSSQQCQDDFFADLAGCGAVALASAAFAPEMAIVCVAGLGLKAMSCRNAAQRQYIECMEKILHPGELAYFQKDTTIRGQKFRIGTTIGITNISMAQYVETREALKNKWRNMSLTEWLRHPVMAPATSTPIKFR